MKRGPLISSHRTGQYCMCKCRGIGTVTPAQGHGARSQDILNQNYTGAQLDESSLYVLIYISITNVNRYKYSLGVKFSPTPSQDSLVRVNAVA